MFEDISFSHGFWIIVGAYHFAISSTLWTLLPFILVSILPFPPCIRNSKYYQFFLNSLYFLGSSAFIIANIVDIAYFPISRSRMNMSVFKFIGSDGGDLWMMLPNLALSFWYVPLLIALLLGLLFYVGCKIKMPKFLNTSFKKYYLPHTVNFILLVGLLFLGLRGGIQLRPLDLFHAGNYTHKYPELVLNTPFTMIKSVDKAWLTDPQFYTPAECDSIFQIGKNPSEAIYQGDTLPNIVVIILEGFSSEYSAYLSGNAKGYTPFLDSLAQQSLCFKGLANEKISMAGVVAVIAGFPNLMDESLVLTQYGQNFIPSIAYYLGEIGYTSSFYHGGKNGTLGLESFTKKLGYEQYVGKNEYNNDADYDGLWGIFDEPFLQFVANKIPSRPLTHSVIYTLSSHNPYTIPKNRANIFDKGTLPIHESVGYTDFALREFFKTAQTKPWFSNTLFIITSDHSSIVESSYYSTPIGNCEVPMIWYFPSKMKPCKSHIKMSQIDIMPSILQYVGYSKPSVNFGSSVFDSTQPRYFIRYSQGEYLFQKSDTTSMFYLQNAQDPFAKAVIQQFYNKVSGNLLR